MGGAIAAPTARTAAMLRRRSIVREGKRIAVSPVWVSMTTNGVGRNRHCEYGAVGGQETEKAIARLDELRSLMYAEHRRAYASSCPRTSRRRLTATPSLII